MTPDDRIILALNSGSSSLKLGCFRAGELGEEALLLSGEAKGIGHDTGAIQLTDAQGATLFKQEHVCESQSEALQRLTHILQAHLPSPPMAVGHRVVHGGPKLREHQLITPEVLEQLEAATHLAPLHVPQALELIHQAEALYPQVPQIACFDTTFHSTMPAVATHLPVPAPLFEEGIQRYGFHGLSCESVVRRLAPAVPARLVIAHLGSGSSVTAVQEGRSLDTTMGLSPTGGLPMSTRSGDLDPEVMLYLLRNSQHLQSDLEQFVNRSCGLAGLSGGEADMQKLLSRSTQADTAASLAVDVFCTAVRKAVGSYAALLGGLDVVVFTGGIGANSRTIRDRVMQGLDFLFQHFQDDSIVVLEAREEQEIAFQCRRLLPSASTAASHG